MIINSLQLRIVLIINNSPRESIMARIQAWRMPLSSLALCALLLCAGAAKAEDYVLTLKDNQFTPQVLTIPVDQKVKLVVKNAGDKVAEFESSDFNREKIVSPGSEITVIIGPLSAGKYTYFDDFHRETTGTVIAK